MILHEQNSKEFFLSSEDDKHKDKRVISWTPFMNMIYEEPSWTIDERKPVPARCLIHVFFHPDCWKARSRGVATNNTTETQKYKDSTNLKVRILQINREFKQRRRRREISK